MTQTSNLYDVIIVGGSYAGLSAAMALGRSLRKVLIVDAGNPCNAQTPHSHNFLTQDGKTPHEISSVSKAQVLRYPTISYFNDFVSSARKENDKFVLKTQTEQIYTSTKLILATGLKDLFTPIPGLKECWGISVLHCPYCHGYEVSHSKLGIIANGETAMEFVKLLLNWSKELMLFTNGDSSLSAEQLKTLNKYKVQVVESPIRNIIHHNGYLDKIQLENNEEVAIKAVFTRLPFTQHNDIAQALGCTLTEHNLIAVDDAGKTNVEGIYAAGDCSIPYRSVSIAVASGTKAGAWVNKELIELEFDRG